jgi:predicted O-methyltransferase YrrM
VRIEPSEVLSIFRGVADRPDSGIVAGIEGVEGFSGARLLALLRALAARIVGGEDAYVEIGVYRGLTLSSVARATAGPCVGIDDFSLFNPSGDNRRRVEAVIEEYGLTNVELLDMDAEVALTSFDQRFPGRRIGVLFVDGGHDHRSQLIALLLARQHLAEGAVIVVDDTNYRHVRQATEDFLRAFPEFALAASASTASHPDNMDEAGEQAVRRGWWNGTQVIVHDPGRTLEREPLPPSDQHRFRLSHDVFRHLLADRAHDALKAVVAFVDDPSDANRRALDDLVEQERSRHGRFEHQNTDSADEAETWTARPAGSPR